MPMIKYKISISNNDRETFAQTASPLFHKPLVTHAAIIQILHKSIPI